MNRTPAENEKDRRIRQLEQLVEERTAQLSIALERLEQSYDDTLEVLGGAQDLKDAETAGHCQRVTAFCISIAKANWILRNPGCCRWAHSRDTLTR